MNHVSYRCSTPRYGAEGRTRTDDLLITSELLCQLSYSSMVRVTGLEPVCLAAVDFESTASAYSAIPAFREGRGRIILRDCKCFSDGIRTRFSLDPSLGLRLPLTTSGS